MKTGKDQIDIISLDQYEFKSDNKSFSQQTIDLQNTPLFFPRGFEKIFLTIYIAILPYLVGLIFTFIYLAKSNYELFLALHKDTPFFLIWAIGYEIIASLLLLYIIKLAFSFTAGPSSKKGFKRDFKRPT